MSAAADIVVLTEYAEWRDERATGGPEDRLSVAVFIEEREAEANERRIEAALAALDTALADTHEGMSSAEVTTELERIRDALLGDREIIVERTLTGPTVRRFV